MSIGRTIKALGRSNDRRFVQLLSEQADLTVRALLALEKFGRQPTANDDLIEEIKEIEREGDAKRRILIDELAHTYATPFDREDLFALSRAVDDILDAANETAVELAIYKIAPPEGLQEMAVREPNRQPLPPGGRPPLRQRGGDQPHSQVEGDLPAHQELRGPNRPRGRRDLRDRHQAELVATSERSGVPASRGAPPARRSQRR